MCQNTKGEVAGPGVVPGASTDRSTENLREKEGTEQACSVESATALPECAPSGALVGDGKELPPPTVFWCLDCLDEGVRTALALDGPSRELCEFHRRERAEKAAGTRLRRSPGDEKCARKGCERAAVGGIFCRAHAQCALSVSCDNLPAVVDDVVRVCRCGHTVASHNTRVEHACNQRECPCGFFRGQIPEEDEQPNDRQPGPVEGDDQWQVRIMRDAFEFAWEQTAERPDLDPRTVAACKRLRDLETRVLKVEGVR